MKKQISNFNQVAYIRRYTVTDGKESGLKVIELYNGVLRVLLNESKALDMMQLFYRGTNMSFISKNGFSTREDDFIKRFEGGMCYTVGLDSAGGREGYPLHGTFHNLKPTVTRCEIIDETIVVEGFVEDSALFGKDLVLKRRYELKLNDNKVHLDDTLENRAKEAAEYCILYHNNIGYPMLDEEDEIEINVNEVLPRTDFAAQQQSLWNRFGSPKDQTDETCYFLDVADGKASVINKKLNRKFTLSFSRDSLPCFVLWKSEKSHDYALGFEPSTTILDEGFKYSTISAGGKVHFELTYQIEEL